MKQILLTDYQENNTIIGKTIKDISYVSGEHNIDSQLIITFTDNTYIYLTASIDEYNDSMFRNGQVVPLQNYSCLPGNIVANENGDKTFEYRHAIKEQIRLGLVKPDREKELSQIKEHEESKEISNRRDYELYLELKKKYDN